MIAITAINRRRVSFTLGYKAAGSSGLTNPTASSVLQKPTHYPSCSAWHWQSPILGRRFGPGGNTKTLPKQCSTLEHDSVVNWACHKAACLFLACVKLTLG